MNNYLKSSLPTRRLTFSILAIMEIFLSCTPCHKPMEAKKISKPKIQNMLYNTDSSYAIAIKKISTRAGDPFPTLVITVLQLSNQLPIFKDRIPGGKIKWISNDVFEVHSQIIRPKDLSQKHPKYLYRYHVTKRLKSNQLPLFDKVYQNQSPGNH